VSGFGFAHAAIGYAEAGWRVMPLRRGRKDPVHRAWPERATSDSARVARWWVKDPERNVGILPSGRLGVLDLDPRHEGWRTLGRLQREHGFLPPTLRVRTGGGDDGVHFYFLAAHDLT
jgi:hypothetical protein